MTGTIKTVIGLLIVLTIVSCAKKELAVRKEFSTPENAYRFWLETAEKGDISNNMLSVTEASKKIMDAQVRQLDEFMRRMNENVRIFKTYTLAEHKVKGDKAIIMLKGPKGETILVPLKKEAEGWKVDLVALFSGGWG